jgi:Histidine kinase-, DNA gyrase B-, and HSP90-like ATPase
MLVNVSPDMGMYHLLRSQGYDPAYAVAEFIDNALQAYLSQAVPAGKTVEPLEIDLCFYSGDYAKASKRNSLVIDDKGPGIKRDRLADAMKPAKPSPVKGLSEFGIGMKAAAVWFSDKWILKTEPAGSKSSYTLTFDLPKLIESSGDTVEVEVGKSSRASGTTMTLSQLRRPVDYARFQQICEVLRELYQRFTAGSSPRLRLTAHYNDTPVSLQFEPGDRTVLVSPIYKEADKKLYAIGKDRTWHLPVDTTFQGARVQGFICLLERGSYVDNPGLIMFRGERVIQGTVSKPNLPNALFKTSNKYSRQRVYGQLFVDGLPVTYTKDGFEIDEGAFAAQLLAIDGMDELLRQAEAYRANKDPIPVKKEVDIPGGKGARSKGSSAAQKGGKGAGAKANAPAPGAPPAAGPAPASKAPPPPPALLKLLHDLKTKASSVALKSMIEETIYQHQFRREIGTALCLRVVVELATLDRIRRKLPAEYAKVSEKAIKALLNYMNSNPASFFDAKADHDVIKCVQGLATGTQADIVLLNNVAHGHYQPNFPELHRFAANIEPLMRWAIA